LEAFLKKATIRPRVPGARLVDTVPPAYREAVVAGARPDGLYTVLLFAHAERDVVTSAEVKHALRRLDAAAPDGVLLVGTVFTLEARVLAAVQSAYIVPLRTAVWTDASAAARQR
jgi:hypothetical protein